MKSTLWELRRGSAKKGKKHSPVKETKQSEDVEEHQSGTKTKHSRNKYSNGEVLQLHLCSLE